MIVELIAGSKSPLLGHLIHIAQTVFTATSNDTSPQPAVAATLDPSPTNSSDMQL